MKIIAHRGYHYNCSKNSLEALNEALIRGYGIETDIRDYHEEIVVSHDMATGKEFLFEELLSVYKENEYKAILALNVKADGLKKNIKELLRKYGINNYFLFDMSIPQMIEFKEDFLVYYTRQSEYEKDPILYECADGVWIDGFYNDEWINLDIINQHLDNGKKVCLVSPELHKRENKEFWIRLKEWGIQSDNVYLCTDLPSEANEYFNERRVV